MVSLESPHPLISSTDLLDDELKLPRSAQDSGNDSSGDVSPLVYDLELVRRQAHKTVRWPHDWLLQVPLPASPPSAQETRAS